MQGQSLGLGCVTSTNPQPGEVKQSTAYHCASKPPQMDGLRELLPWPVRLSQCHGLPIKIAGNRRPLFPPPLLPLMVLVWCNAVQCGAVRWWLLLLLVYDHVRSVLRTR